MFFKASLLNPLNCADFINTIFSLPKPSVDYCQNIELVYLFLLD